MTNDKDGSPAPDADRVRAHLDSALGSATTPTGTLAAHALHDLYLSEARQVGRDIADEAWLALGREAVEEVSSQLEKLTGRGGPDFTLPAGIDMMAVMGTVIVGAEQLGFDIDRPGLHLEEELPTKLGGSNLALLLSSIERMSGNLPCHALGSPAIVERFNRDRPSEVLQFPPFDGAGGAVLERDMDLLAGGEYFCTFTHDEVTKLAESIVGDMRLFWDNGSRLAPEIERALTVGNRIAKQLRDVGVRAATVEYGGRKSSRGYAVFIEFEGWDHCFRRSVMAQRYAPTAYPPAELDAGALDRADNVHQFGADGWIGGVARAIAMAAPGGAATVLAELAEGFQSEVTLTSAATGDDYEFKLVWHEREIVARSHYLADIEIAERLVKLNRRQVPETVADLLAGKPLHQLFDEPFRCGTPIKRAVNGHNGLELEPDIWLVKCDTGRMWRRPRTRPRPSVEGVR